MEEVLVGVWISAVAMWLLIAIKAIKLLPRVWKRKPKLKSVFVPDYIREHKRLVAAGTIPAPEDPGWKLNGYGGGAFVHGKYESIEHSTSFNGVDVDMSFDAATYHYARIRELYFAREMEDENKKSTDRLLGN